MPTTFKEPEKNYKMKQYIGNAIGCARAPVIIHKKREENKTHPSEKKLRLKKIIGQKKRK